MEEAHKKEIYIKKLILLAKEGDETAFEEVYNTYYTPLFRYIRTRVSNREVALDLTQTIFMKIWNSINNWNEEHTSPTSFFFTVARNSLIDYYRKNSHKEIVSDALVGAIGESTESGEDLSRERELGEIMRQSISKLSIDQQEIIRLYYMNDLTYKEIAEITKKREDAIRQIHSRAIKKLRQLYKHD